MHIMLAEEIGGWLIAAGALFGGAGMSALALIALIPASKGKSLLTLLLSAPAFILGVLVTIWLGYGYFSYSQHQVGFEIGSDLVRPWVFMAAPSLVTSLLAWIILWFNRYKTHDA